MIRTEEDIACELAGLLRIDPSLRQVVDIAGEIPMRRTTPGLAGLLATIVAQQVSVVSAAAILARFAALVNAEDADAILALDDAAYRSAGFSMNKQRTAIAVANAVCEGRLDLAGIHRLPSKEATKALTTFPGIGVWTAECYLLFAAGHSDVFPAGDLALRVAVGEALGMTERPKEKTVAALAERWRPHRSVAARLFWQYYHVVTRRDAAPAEATAGRAGATLGHAAREGRVAAGFTKATR